MTFTIHTAEKRKTKIRIGLSGTSGSGKTYSSLLLASGITAWEKICVIDTENGSADLYSHLGAYKVITLTAPFTPERYIEAIHTAEQAGMEVIVIDSITHEWDGQGGCLQIVEEVAKASVSKNSYTAWAKVTPRHNAFIQSILQSPCHVITTVRRKQDYDMSKDSNNRTVIAKVGMKEITREGFEYELTLSFALSQNHLAETSKDRTGLFMDKPEFIITEKTGKSITEWANSGKEAPVVVLIAEKVQSKTTVLESDNLHFCNAHNKPMKFRGNGRWDHRARLDSNYVPNEKGFWYHCVGTGWVLSGNQPADAIDELNF